MGPVGAIGGRRQPVSAGAADFITACLHKDPAMRLTVPQLLQHRWIRAHARQLRVGD
ncbi:hypothetical protein TSOC_009926 [Tetrabaena socialis]|uniref:Protein kinase domain-containing protein n=1 Tax=Tetrabaena socialis TaxID=47790 RepID=A0A2J7ZUI9_9CHLO|nr:hypothetical protein TSOC_009926 [Tetrabaena socialis]|eukprot:PNH03941.1 hypothetical protein TSOC_009926 [Tetrabaena socialis]